MDLKEFQELLRKDRGTVSISVAMLLKLMHTVATAAALVDAYEDPELNFEALMSTLKKDLIWMGMKFE